MQVYVGKIQHDDNFTKLNRKNYDSRVVKSTIHEPENLRPSNNYNNYINKENKQHKFANFEGSNYSNIDWNLLYDN